jgi:hypothetical protein
MAREKKTAAEIMAAGHARAEQARVNMEATSARAEVAAAEQGASLPATYVPPSEGLRAAAPAVTLWGALFSARALGPRRSRLQREELAQAGGYGLLYTGEPLDQGDLDVFLAVLHLAHRTPVGTPVTLGGGALLAALGLADNTGAARDGKGGEGSRERVERRLMRLKESTVWLRGPRGELDGISLLTRATRGRRGEAWRVTLSPDLPGLYLAGVAGVDLRVRAGLHKRPLAQWLHAWLCSHHGAPYACRLDTLRRLSGSNTGEQKKFNQLLDRALLALDQALRDAGAGSLEWDRGPALLSCRVLRGPRPIAREVSE